MSERATLETIGSHILGATQVVVVSHYNPDIDAYGSSCGLTLALKERGVEVVCVNESGSLARYHTFPEISAVQSEMPAGSRELLVVCDCGDLGRIGDSLKSLAGQFVNVVNLDHHVSNSMFGNLNYVDTEASSTSEIVLRLLHAMGITPSREVATLLYAGLLGDTGSFRYSSTTARTFEVAQQLLQCGVKPYEVATTLFGEQKLSAVKFQSEALLNLTILCEGKFAEVIVDRGMYERHGATTDDSEGLVERARDIEGVLAAVVMRDDTPESGETLWRVSLRSKCSEIDVATVAQSFGGGGHRQAAAFRWRRGLDELRERVRTAMASAIEKRAHSA